MPRPPNVRVRIDVRDKCLLLKANGHPDTADTTRARAHTYIERTLPTSSLINKQQHHTPPSKDVRVSVAFCHKAICPDTIPDMSFLRCPNPAMVRVLARTSIDSRFQ